jgi:hypothetical protein
MRARSVLSSLFMLAIMLERFGIVNATINFYFDGCIIGRAALKSNHRLSEVSLHGKGQADGQS